MSAVDKIRKFIERKKILTSTSTGILTPNLGKGNHFIASYHRIQFIDKVIEYLVYMAISFREETMSGKIILDAVCKTSWYLGVKPSDTELERLLIEMAIILELLDIKELGTITLSNPLHIIDESQPKEIERFLGYSFSLSQKGWESYKKQEYQILSSQFKSDKISRMVSYIAVFLAILSLICMIFK